LAERLGAQRHDFLPGLLELPQDIASVLEQQRALRRGLHALLAAGEQAHAELIFQVAHVAAERRLGNVQGLRGMREAADFERLDEIPQLPAIHTEISICDGCVANYRLFRLVCLPCHRADWAYPGFDLQPAGGCRYSARPFSAPVRAILVSLS